MSAIFTEEGLAIRACPLHGCKQESVATAQGKQLLLGAGAKTLLTDDLTAISFSQSRGDDFRRAGSAGVDHRDDWSGKQIHFWISGECFQRLSFASDSLCNDTVFDEEVCDSHGFIE